MTDFTVYPAIDLRGGRCVRLKQGDFGRAKEYDADPVERARDWESQGAQAIHVVDLDGAEEGRPVQLELIGRIARAVGVPLQVGGGVRSVEDLRAVWSAGARRVVMGTAAVDDRDLRLRAVEEAGDSLLVAVARLRRLDHMAIFILIAGTYTPICVLALEGGWGAGLLGVVWALAFCGVVLKLLWMDAPRWLSVSLYLAMGWVAVVAISAILKAVPPGGLAWILGGGLVYSAGAVVYGLKWPNIKPGVFGFHELWHLFVLAGSACHFWAMLQYIALL